MNEHKKDKKSFQSIFEDSFEKQNGHSFPSFEDQYDEEYSLTDELDHEILMHRDAHFGGDFGVMIDYYQNEGVGIHPDIDLDRIYYLASVEKEVGHDLAPLILSGPEAERVATAKKAYAHIKEIYELSQGKISYSRLISDLILSEEEEPDDEIEAIVSQGTSIVPDLLRIVHSDEAYDPLFPGYGYAPYFAITCLGKIGDPIAIVPIFEVLNREFLFDDLVIVEALAGIGKESKSFLMKILKGRPITKDNENAAFALSAFSEDTDVSLAAFHELRDPEIIRLPMLRTYLLYCCEGLKDTKFREEFLKMAEDPKLPLDMKQEIQNIAHGWK